MLISQISRLTDRAAGLLTSMIDLHPVFRVAQFKLDPSTFMINKEASTFTGSAARAINAAAQRDAQSPSTALATLKAYTREYSLDEMYLADQNVGIAPNALKQQSMRKLKALAKKMADEIQDDMFVGDGSSYKMIGCSNFVLDADAAGQTARYGFTQAELAAMNKRAELQLIQDNFGPFLELLEKYINAVPGANALECNINLAARLTTIAREKHIYGQINDAYKGTLETILNVPIIKLPTTSIPQTESDGEHADCTSLYIKRYAEELGFAYSTNTGFKFKDFPDDVVKPDEVARMAFHIESSPETTDSMIRLSRIRL